MESAKSLLIYRRISRHNSAVGTACGRDVFDISELSTVPAYHYRTTTLNRVPNLTYGASAAQQLCKPH
jgi:hypothetical protein